MVAAGVAIGVVIVAIAFARSRGGDPGAAPLYWVGQTTIYLVPAIAVFRGSRVSRSEGAGIALVLAIATYVVFECYSPLQFTFSDEFQHLSTLNSILSTNHLFASNPSLPVSPYYPGLEIATSALVRTTHMSVYLSAAVLMGIAHVVTTVGVFTIALRATRSPRASVLAVLIFASGSNFLFFTSYYAYESLGLTLMVTSLLALVGMVNAESRAQSLSWGFLFVFLGAATTVTHHVSSYALVAFGGCIAIVHMIRRRDRDGLLDSRGPEVWVGQPLCAVGLVVVCVGLWDLVVARPTFSYLQSTISSLVKGKTFSVVNASQAPVLPKPIFTLTTQKNELPTFDHYTGYAWTLFVVVLLLWGLRCCWKRRSEYSSVLWAMAISSSVVFVGIVLQATTANAELGSRLLGFALVPAGIVAGLGLERVLARMWPTLRLDPFAGVGRRALVVTLSCLFFVGAIALRLAPVLRQAARTLCSGWSGSNGGSLRHKCCDLDCPSHAARKPLRDRLCQRATDQWNRRRLHRQQRCRHLLHGQHASGAATRQGGSSRLPSVCRGRFARLPGVFRWRITLSFRMTPSPGITENRCHCGR